MGRILHSSAASNMSALLISALAETLDLGSIFMPKVLDIFCSSPPKIQTILDFGHFHVFLVNDKALILAYRNRPPTRGNPKIINMLVPESIFVFNI
uniref:Uncharacterized protein n=1 Tax=mine drainage metagenome TaxID=410659 RepID=E6PN85_9ZZZZ